MRGALTWEAAEVADRHDHPKHHHCAVDAKSALVELVLASDDVVIVLDTRLLFL